jgi:hypothetical protein
MKKSGFRRCCSKKVKGDVKLQGNFGDLGDTKLILISQKVAQQVEKYHSTI